MVAVENVSGRRYRSRSTGTVEPGETVDVDSETAAYLCDERGGFERSGGLASFDGDDDTDAEPETYTCDEDGCDFETETPQGLAAHSRSHG